MYHSALTKGYEPKPFFVKRNRRQTIELYLRSLKSDAAILEKLSPWQTEIRCNTLRYFLSLDNIKPSDPDTTELYTRLAILEERGRKRENQAS